MTVKDRYYYNKIVKDIKSLLQNKTICINQYYVKSRQVSKVTKKTTLYKNEILIVDGVVALDIKELRKIANLKIFVEIDEQKRKKRFYKFYKYKELNQKDIENLYHTRLEDENPYIINSRKHADIIFNLDTSCYDNK